MESRLFLLVIDLFVVSAYVDQDLNVKVKDLGSREEDMKRGAETKQLFISMPPVETTYPDQYICYAKSLEEIGDAYVISSVTVSDRRHAHHVATGLCNEPGSSDLTWDCTRVQGRVCKGDSVNFGGWDQYTKKNGKHDLPKDVSVRVGRKSKLKYFMIQIHFTNPVKDPKYSAANVTLNFVTQPTKFNYQTYAFLNTGIIPGNRPKGYFSEMACEWKRPPAYAFRYFLHSHHYGILIEGYLIRNDTWILVGSQLSQEKKKDIYDVPGGPIEVRPGDILASRCLYVNEGPEPVKFGMSEDEEMCNFELHLGYDPIYADHFRRPPTCRAESPKFKFCDHPATDGLC